jgi:hypothetical protein
VTRSWKNGACSAGVAHFERFGSCSLARGAVSVRPRCWDSPIPL